MTWWALWKRAWAVFYVNYVWREPAYCEHCDVFKTRKWNWQWTVWWRPHLHLWQTIPWWRPYIWLCPEKACPDRLAWCAAERKAISAVSVGPWPMSVVEEIRQEAEMHRQRMQALPSIMTAEPYGPCGCGATGCFGPVSPQHQKPWLHA